MNETDAIITSLRMYNDGYSQALEDFAKLVWEDIEERYKNDIKVLGYLSVDNLLRDVHNSICCCAEQLKR